MEMDISSVFNALKYGSDKEKKAIYIKLSTDEKLLGEFLTNAKSGDYLDRIIIAKAAAYVQSKKMLGTVMGFLNDENKYVRQAACDALGEMEYKEAIPYLTKEMYSDESFIVWTRAAVALYKLGEEKGVKMLIENYNFSEPLKTEPAVAEALNELKIDPHTYKGRKKKCFVVTACEGENSDAVNLLSEWRDNHLAGTLYGRALIYIYNIMGPVAAKTIDKSSVLRNVARKTLIRALIYVVSKHSIRKDRHLVAS
ncbi:HEAT repeat domain-containing protein [candidate division WOR-3 bacterium]|nr:HEAT repeat domain-containing protein [candidate division WOR-3 bacterium]